MFIFKNKSYITGFILGIVFVIFLYHAFTVYQVRALAVQNRADLDAIIGLIQANNPTQAVSQPVPVSTQ